MAPLARALGLEDWQVGLMISVSAVMVAGGSRYWGEHAQRFGYRRVLGSAAISAGVAMGLFASFIVLGMRGAVSGAGLLLLLVLSRGVAFGASLAAITPTTQAYVAAHTSGVTARVRGMARLGAVHAVAMITGAAAGGVLAGVSILLPFTVVPILLLLVGAMVLTMLRSSSGVRVPDARPFPRTVGLRDRRLRPYLVIGFGLYLVLGLVQVLTGFLAQDRFPADAETAAAIGGIALFSLGLGMLLSQSFLVPRLGLSPRRLAQGGAAVAALGLLAVLPSTVEVVLFVAYALFGIGMGMALPGYLSAATLIFSPEQQGAVSGLMSAVTASSFIVTPTLVTALYTAWADLPFLLAVLTLVTVTLIVPRHDASSAASAVTPS